MQLRKAGEEKQLSVDKMILYFCLLYFKALSNPMYKSKQYILHKDNNEQ